MKKLVSLIMVVIMLSALCATAMASVVFSTVDGRWYSKQNGYIVFSCGSVGDGVGRTILFWMDEQGITQSGYVFETVGKEGENLPMLVVFSTEKSITVYQMTVEDNILTLQQIGGSAPNGIVTESEKYTFERQ